MSRLAPWTLAWPLLLAQPAFAQASQAEAGTEAPREAALAPAPQAVGTDILYSTDAEGTDVIRAGVNLDWLYDGLGRYRGVRLEKAHFNPLGTGWQARDRVYVRAADRIGAWKWSGQIGTDGTTVLGAATLHDESRFRKEFFLEREVVESPQGLSRGIYYSFGGAAIDLPLSARNTVTLVAGLQEFTGDNVRTHLRASYVLVLKPEWGLSAQLRTRGFASSQPGEYDYYSPRWYAQVLPVLQLRRFTGSGWRYLLAAGYGAQRDSSSEWRSSRYFNAQASSPAVAAGWGFSANLLYSNTPVSTGFTYSYMQLSLGLTRAL